MTMGPLALTIRVLLLLAAIANFAGHLKGDGVVTTSAELNRCLTAVRVALTRRGVVDKAPHDAARPGLRNRPTRFA